MDRTWTFIMFVNNTMQVAEEKISALPNNLVTKETSPRVLTELGHYYYACTVCFKNHTLCNVNVRPEAV